MPPSVDSPEDIAETSELLTRLHIQTWGDVADRRASDLLAYADTQGRYQKCMADEGYSYTPPPFDDAYLGQTRMSPPGWFREVVPPDVEFARNHGLGIGERHQRQLALAVSRGRAPWDEPPNPGYTSLPSVDRPAYEAAGARCGPADFYGNGQVPVLSEVLRTALRDAVAEVVDSPAVQRASSSYPACMAEAGFAVEDRADLIVELTNAYGQAIQVDRPVNWRTFATTQAWLGIVNREQNAALADARCRTDVFALTMTLVRPHLDRFASDHANEIQQLAGQWAEVRAKAAAITLPL